MDDIIVWSPGVTLDAIEKQVILKAFRFYRGNKTATATALGIAIRTLDNKLEKYEVDGKAATEREQDEKQRRAEWLKRQRGTVGTGIDDSPAAEQRHATTTEGNSVSRANAGVRVESAVETSEEPALSVSERKEVQGVLPKQVAQSGQRRAR